MKMMKNIALTFSMALAALAVPTAVRAADATGNNTGHIVSIDQVKPLSANPSSPLQVGEEVYILVRLVNENYMVGDKTQIKRWKFGASAGAGSDQLASALYLPKLMLSVGGKVREAAYSDFGPNMEVSGASPKNSDGTEFPEYTDFYFVYKVSAGDIGRPIKMLNKDGKVPTAAEGGLVDFWLHNVNTSGGLSGMNWDLRNDSSTNLCGFHFCDQDLVVNDLSGNYPEGPHDRPRRNFTSLDEGVYVQTVDFSDADTNGATAPTGEEIWRYVYPGSSTAVNLSPSLVGKGEAVVYVWSSDESVVRPVASHGNVIKVIDGKRVLQISISSDATTTQFSLEGLKGKTGETASIYLSSSTTLEQSAVGETLTDSAVVRTVCVTDPPKPKVTVMMNGADSEATVTCSPDYTQPSATLTVKVSPAVDYPVTVDIKAALKAEEATSPALDLATLFNANLIGLSLDEDGSRRYDANVSQVTIPAGKEVVNVLVYALGFNAQTLKGVDNGISFEPKLVGTYADDITASGKATLYIMSNKPVITDIAPGVTGVAEVTAGVGYQFVIKLSDNYKNLNDATGYTFKWTMAGSSLESNTNVTYDPYSDGFVVSRTFYGASGTHPVSVVAVAPDGKMASDPCQFDLQIAKAKEVYARITATGKSSGTCVEGENVEIAIHLEGGTYNINDSFAFLIPLDEATSNAVDLAADGFGRGILVPKATAESDPVAISFIDGRTTGKFNVVLSSNEEIITPISDFAPQSFRMTIENKPPVVPEGNRSVTVNGYGVAAGGTLREGVVSKGLPATLSVRVADVRPDLCATNDVAANDALHTDANRRLQVKWVIDDGRLREFYSNVSSDTERASLDYTFINKTEGSPATVEIYLKDKDMGVSEAFDGEPAFTFNVPVDDSPRVMLSFANSYDTGDWYEDEVNIYPPHMLRVRLSRAAETDVVVRVTAPIASDGGFVRFQTTDRVTKSVDANGDEIVGSYDVRFSLSDESNADLVPAEMDGTPISAGGISISAKVITDTDSGFGGKKWNEYYSAAEPLSVRVINREPAVGLPTEQQMAITNENIKVFTPFSVSYRVASDVMNDLTNGVTVNLYVDGTLLDTAVASNTITQVFSKKVEFQSPGVHTVSIGYADKDMASANVEKLCTLVYKVMATKAVEVRAHGPASGVTAPSGHSTRYSAALGLGAGYVTSVQNPQKVSSWVSTYSVAVADSTLPVEAVGYQVGSSVNDNIDEDGNYPLVKPKFDYKTLTGLGAEGLDSFFYAWVYNNTKSTDGIEAETTILLGPAKKNSFAIPLQAYEADKLAYDTQYWEAVFAREYRAEDNAGDINCDGIPDIYVVKYGFGVIDTLSLALAGDDLDDIGGYNLDEDYMPTTDTAGYGAFIPGLEDTWVTTGLKFDAYTEVRGFHEGLNDAPTQVGLGNIVTPDVSTNTFSALELDAARIAGALLPDGNPDITKWSPERPTDPTKADTDNDGLPDGYEYYIWYKAHVGYMENGVHKFLTGRRYVPQNPGDPETISSEAIKSAYDPVVRNSGFAQTTDTDNDGIPDYVEFTIGTNPFDFDTDGDGLPDGYELAMTAGGMSSSMPGGLGDQVLDPLKWATDGLTCDALLNSDNDKQDASVSPLYRGDAMASAMIKMSLLCATSPEGEVEWFCAPTDTPFETVDSDKVTGTLFKAVVNGKAALYLTSVALDPAAECLSRALSRRVAWKVTEEGEDPDKVMVLGEPVELPCGCAISDVMADVECTTKAVENPPEMFWGAWKYGINNGFARGGERKHSVENPLKGYTVHSVSKADVQLVHFQVYQELGFDPRTAWRRSPVPEGFIGVNTRNFTHYDEYLVMAFFMHEGCLTKSDLQPTLQRPLPFLWQKYSTNPLNSDTDADGMPDGWELYLMSGPKLYDENTGDRLIDYGPQMTFSPLWNIGNVAGTNSEGYDLRDIDDDKLDWPNEYSGVESVAEYEQIAASIVCIKPEWRNKKWPTNPWAEDTDGDGIVDGEEFDYFAYGGSGAVGGGLNPLSWDTDGDGLPDPWEAEFAGTGVSNAVQSASNDTAAVENMLESGAERAWKGANIKWNYDGMDGTVADAVEDYDGDGLANWQEYMVGAMRCWRYDDTISSWQSHKFNFEDSQKDWDDFWYKTLVDEQGEEYNPNLVNGRFDLGIYFSCCTNAWDSVNGGFYMFRDGVYHALKHAPAKYNPMGDVTLNAWTYKAASSALWDGEPPFSLFRTYGEATDRPPSFAIYPKSYICCDPRLADTDRDGMDDYYELFHGMNPLLGMSGVDKGLNNSAYDVIYNAYGGDDDYEQFGIIYWSAENNYWLNTNAIHRTGTRFKPDGISTDDFFAFPWLSGRATADPDGDNLRNQDEAIMANIQAASTYLHTDPTPLWMTDTSYADSFTRRYYRGGMSAIDGAFGGNGGGFRGPDGKEYRFEDFPGFSYDSVFDMVFHTYKLDKYFHVADWFYNFEENEGFDSDHDYLSDYDEAKGKMRPASDAQRTDSPHRRQAMWFNGTDAFLQTALPVSVLPISSYLAAEPRQNFLYYTVECWVKADEQSLSRNGEHTIIERAIWTDTANVADEKLLRKNFLIGIKNGRWYTKFDTPGTEANDAVTLASEVAATTEWTHLAASFDGSALRLYVNGIAEKVDVSLRPEHGTAAAKVDGAGALDRGSLKYDTISILVGASAMTRNGVIFDNAYRTGEKTTLDDYGDFFCGYIDEIRIWDGARPAADILADVSGRVRYTADIAGENQQKVFSEWLAGARRAESAAKQLSPELKYHWSFDHLPGAVSAADVMKTPAGFSTSASVTDARAIWSRPEGWYNPWWKSVSVRSTVYTDTAWVPWIADTVGHLPRVDLTTADSVYWSENFAGLLSAAAWGYDSFRFPRTGEVWSKWRQMAYKDYVLIVNGEETSTSYDIYQPVTRYKALLTQNDPTLIETYRFALRDRDREGFDLLPMGGAFPRRISTAEGGMWDDGTAADAWLHTGNDYDNNGLPDWWEEYARENYCDGLSPRDPLTLDTIVNYRGVEMPAWQAYLREMAAGTVYSNGEMIKEVAEYSDQRDNDKDGLPDWWESLFGFDTVTVNDANSDPDGDGLSNYQEYLISEVYARMGALSGNVAQFPVLNPTLAQSTSGQVVPDYFLRHGSLYLGEMFADHDQIEDEWEDSQSEIDIGGTRIANVSRFIYDADKDPDEMGLSNWSRARAAHDRLNVERTYIGTVTNRLELSFELFQDEYSDKLEELRSQYGSNNVERAGEYATLKRDPVRGYKYHYYFNAFQFEDRYEERLIRPEVKVDAAVTYNGNQPFGDGMQIVIKAWGENRGLTRAPDAVWMFPVDASRVTHYQPLKLRKPLEGFLREGKTTFVAYCASAEKQEAGNKQSGEAAVQAVPAFVPGQPYGVVSGIEVGYLSGESFSVELTDISPVMMRIDLAQALSLQQAFVEEKIRPLTQANWDDIMSDGDNDAKNAYRQGLIEFQNSLNSCIDRMAYSEDYAGVWKLDYVGTNFALSASNALPLRVVQGKINGADSGRDASYYRVVLDTKVALSDRSVITEADVLSKGELDFGWSTLVPAYRAGGAANRIALTNATFSVVFGKPVYGSGDSRGVYENVLGVAMINHYEYGSYQTPVQDKKLLTFVGQPTFSWVHTNTIGKLYPAFQLRVWADKDMTTLVYDSGALRAPRRDVEGRYSWTAPLWVGMMTPEGVEFKSDTPYYWSVSMLDAKFTTPAGDETADAFAMQAATPGGGLDDYAVLQLAVKYMGPGGISTNAANGVIRVEAFDSDDFAGQPVSVGYVKDTSTLAAPGTVVCNAMIAGLEADDRVYYVRAFIDSDGDGKRSSWESWGYAAYVDADPQTRKNADASTYKPRAFAPSKAMLSEGQRPQCVVYIEDSDTNNNLLPDIWEWDADGVLGGPSADPTGSLSPFIVDRESSIEKVTGIYRELAEKNASPLLYSTMMMRAAAGQAAGSPAAALVLGGINVTEIETIPEVAISAFSTDNGKISLNLSADGTVGGATASAVPATISVRLTLTLQYATALDAAWNEAGAGTAMVTLGAEPKTVTSDELSAGSGRTLTDVLRETIEANQSGCYFRMKVKVGSN